MFDEGIMSKLRDLDEETWMFPWMKYTYNTKEEKNRQTKFWSNVGRTDEARYELFFSLEDRKSREKLIDDKIVNYMDITFFSDKFNLKPWELERCDASWVDDMIKISNAENKAQNSNTLKAQHKIQQQMNRGTNNIGSHQQNVEVRKTRR